MTFLIGILAGFFTALMSAVNDRLRRHLGVPFLTALVSFFVGLVVVVLMALVFGDLLGFRSDAFDRTPWWAWLGGFLGMMSLSAVVLVFPRLGAMQAAVLPILGQVLAGLLIDSFGWLNAPQTAFSGSRMLGAVLVLTGVFVAVVLPDWRAGGQDKSGRHLWLWRAVGVLGGVCMAVQAAVNGELGRVLASPLNASVVSFLGGTLGLALIVSFFEKSWANLAKPMNGEPWWIWLGGVFSALFISISIWLVPKIGTGSVVVLMLTGSVAGGLLVDTFGLFGAPKKPLRWQKVAGVALLLAGVGCIRLI